MFSTVFSVHDDGIPMAFLLDAAIDREREKHVLTTASTTAFDFGERMVA
jgi:hypothetical protein